MKAGLAPYVTMSDAAILLGVSRQRAHVVLKGLPDHDTLRTGLGLFVRRSAVAKLARLRATRRKELDAT